MNEKRILMRIPLYGALFFVVLVTWIFFSQRSAYRERVNERSAIFTFSTRCHDLLMSDVRPTREHFSDDPFLSDVEERFVILWVAFPDNSDEIWTRGGVGERILIAYEKGADQNGGRGVFLNGSVDELTADEVVRLIEESRSRVHLDETVSEE